jgi:hypothetical protein
MNKKENMVSIPEKLKYFVLLDGSIMALIHPASCSSSTRVIIRKQEGHVGEDNH